MKKKIFFAAMAIALASCTSDDFIGENNNSPNLEKASNAIVFNSGASALTRGGDLVDDEAATKLKNQFIVYGTKHASAEAADETNDEKVFTNYKVEYTANTAGHTASNTHNWEYVGLTPFTSGVTPVATSQAIKYWDYSAANGYTFYGIASKDDIAAGHVTVTKVTAVTTTDPTPTVYDKGYTVKLDKDATLDNLYVADRKPVVKGDFGKPVTLTFRNFGARVRVGFYETIPGYTVTINKFYYDDNATAAVTTFGAMDVAHATKFAASLQNITKDLTGTSTNTISVSYYNGSNGPENQVKLGASTVNYNYSLVLGEGVVGHELGTSSSAPTWDKTDGAYTTVYPFEANSNPMLVKVDYTLTSEDGSGETIVVKGANVVVPTQYVQWKSNFAYTYLFKIAPNTNGSTDPDDADKQGLYPITFDAVVVDIADDKTQETITNFEDYSITTYANGSKVTTNNEYKAGEDIYIVKSKNSDGTVVVPTGIGTAAGNAQVYVATTTGDAISEATVKAKLTGSPNGITLDATTSGEAASLVADGKVPAADGTNFVFAANSVVKFTPSPAAATTYVYVFTRTAYVAPTYSAAASWSDTETYYFKTDAPDNVYYPAAGINAANFATYQARLFTRTAAGTAGEYDIKVIKVIP